MQTSMLRRTLLGSLLAVSVTAMYTPARAVAQNDAPAGSHDDNGFDEGLLGLLGLAGLLGLKRRDRDDLNRGR